MSDSDRSVALATACDDLQAQLEAGVRSMRHLDQDITSLNDLLQTAFAHAERLGRLQHHMNELRAHMREQRHALREVRSAAHNLCASVAQTREVIVPRADDQAAIERGDAAILADQEMLHRITSGPTGDEARAEPLRTAPDQWTRPRHTP